MREKEHLSMYGIGPLLVAVVLISTAVFGALHWLHILPSFEIPFLKIPCRILGVLLWIIAPIIWCLSVFKDKIDKNILENTLVTTGVYAWVRNPIYTAFLFLAWGVLLWTNNVYAIFLFLFHWIFTSILLMETEEKWLLKAFGQKFLDYKNHVNRLFLWFPKRK